MEHKIAPEEWNEWKIAFQDIIREQGGAVAEDLLESLSALGREKGLQTAGQKPCYANTIPRGEEPPYPGDLKLEKTLSGWIRWNAMAMVVRGNKRDPDTGGHIGTYASISDLYEVGFHHFWRAPSSSHPGDLVFFQGHSSPGIYARAFLEGRLSREQLERFRQEVGGGGLSSYPHPWLMPTFWQFPTVSMGLGPLQAIYLARYIRYLEARGLQPASDRKVWCFCGDGEMDEPESVGALTFAAREKLNHLIFVVNCNLQRLDGPVRGNGRIVEELAALFQGAGWNVIQVVTGSLWDSLLQKDKRGLIRERFESVVDGEWQNYVTRGPAYFREHFFGASKALSELVSDWTDEALTALPLARGGHDPIKIYAAYKKASLASNAPTVILAKTVKGFGLGAAGEALNTAHNTKKLDEKAVSALNERLNLELPPLTIQQVEYITPEAADPAMQYLQLRRKALGGFLPQRRANATDPLSIPPLSSWDSVMKGTGERKISTTMAFVRWLSQLSKDPTLGSRLVPIVPDEARTFGMEGLFRQIGIYAEAGQLYKPVDAEQVMFYKESKNGQILQEGLNEAGSMASFIAAGTAYSHSNINTIPFYIYYSMFGFQRVGDLAWAAGDARTHGFLLGATSGRTTLNGEGLQHEDGHSHLMAATIPNCVSYDPTYAYELGVILHRGLERMLVGQESVFYYITLMNENYEHPDLPVQPDIESAILRGLYHFKHFKAADPLKHKTTRKNLSVQLLGSGTIFREVLAAAECLSVYHGIEVDVFSAPSFNELAREGFQCERWNRLHPREKPRLPYVTAVLSEREGPVVAATDYIRAYPEQIRGFVPRRYTVLGTDGFGRSDSRAQLRRFFEVDRHHIVLAALKSWMDEGQVTAAWVEKAMKCYEADGSNPLGMETNAPMEE